MTTPEQPKPPQTPENTRKEIKEPTVEGSLLAANSFREQGHSMEALRYSEQAFGLAVKAGNIPGATEALASQGIDYRLLQEETADTTGAFIGKAKAVALYGVELATKSNKPEALFYPNFELGRTLAAMGDYEGSVKAFKAALEAQPKSTANTPSVNADVRLQLEIASYRGGDKDALARAEKVLGELATIEEPDKFSKEVWVSGGHLKLAEGLFATDPVKAKEHLEEAKKIIEANPKLVVRKKQLDKLTGKLK